MDNLALTRIGNQLAAALPGTALAELRQESADRFRLVFAAGRASLVLAVSLRPDRPWIGRPPRRRSRTAWTPDPFAVVAARELLGRVVASVAKPPIDRSLILRFAGDRALVVEVATHGANLVVLGQGDEVLAAARHPKGSAARLAEGGAYAPRAVPEGKLDPFRADARSIDLRIAGAAAAGATVEEALRREVLALGEGAAALVADESRRTGATPGEILRTRVDALVRGDGEIVVEGPRPVEEALADGTLSPETFRLLPWRPERPSAGTILVAGEDAAATAGLYYDGLEAAADRQARVAALRGILANEARKAETARARAREELAAFAEPERFRKQGEALLAGLTGARREGPVVRVPDPYDEAGGFLEIEAPPGVPLSRVADALFGKHRRAQRGLAAAEARIAALTARLERIAGLLERPAPPTEAGAEDLEAGMRAIGLAVGLARPTRAAAAAARLRKPALEGVRIVESVDGLTILVGRTGRDNDRLTFKIAAPDDLWLHAQGVPGAHVVVRQPGGELPRGTLLEAAKLAAWFSDARSQPQAEVQWTRRKFVRRAKGAAPGTVVLKRFQTVRVRPEAPPEDRRSGDPS